MRDHAIISPHFWLGDTGKEIRGDSDTQVVFLYLLTCPSSNMIGLYHLGLPTICHETGLSTKGASKGLRRGEEGQFCFYDMASETVFIPLMAKYQLGETLSPKDNRHKAVLKMLNQVHKSPFLKDFLDIYSECYCIDKTMFLEAPSKPLRRGREKFSAEKVDQDQEQEQEQEQEQNTPIVPTGTCGNGSALFDEWWNLYPRKEAKGKALEAWKKAGKRLVGSGMSRPDAVAHLLDRVQAYASSPRATQSDPSKIPHPATWLNQGRYDDDPQTWQTPLTDRVATAGHGSKDDTYIDLNFDLEGD